MGRVGISAMVKSDLETILVSRSFLETENNMERSLVLVKPDGVQRGLIGEVIAVWNAAV